ncbi:MAG: phosphoserine transaminase [Actinomycetaceae bacterium]|nr:phosphoserine transaminase [Actinomycetaceae bacterium]
MNDALANNVTATDPAAPALPADGRFGSGPSKVRREQIAAIGAPGSPMGTSHRRPGVRDVVGSIRKGLMELYNAPEDYTVLLGNGGATALWDAITFCLIEDKAQCAVMGEFSGKAARAVKRAPWLAEPEIIEVEPGGLAVCSTTPGIDTYLYAHNETSTGAISPLRRYGDDAALTIVDGTSVAGGQVIDVADVDFYYFSPQKCFGADGGLWLAFASPAALERIAKLVEERWVPDFFNLQIAVNNSLKNQTYNTPALATLIMLNEQIKWMLANGGLAGMEARSRKSSSAVYEWAENHPLVQPLIKDPAARSHVVTTLRCAPEAQITKVLADLRDLGVVDIEPYRSLGADGMRISTFPSVDPDDVKKLLSLLDSALI